MNTKNCLHIFLLLAFLLIPSFVLNAQVATTSEPEYPGIDDPAVFLEEEKIPDVYVVGYTVDNQSLNAEDIVTGKFTLTNKSNYDATQLYYYLSLVEYENDDREKIIGRYGPIMSEQPLFVSAWQDKEVSFSYGVPKVVGDGYLVLHIETFLDSKIPMGSGEVPVTVSGAERPFRVSSLKVTVDEKEFGAQDGPTIQPNSVGYAELVFSDVPESINITPVLTVSDLSPLGEEVKKTLEQVTLTPANNTLSLELPTEGLKPGVYTAAFEFIKDGIVVAPTAYARYIVGGDIVNIEAVTVNKDFVKKGEIVTVTAAFSSAPIDIVLGEKPLIGSGVVYFSLKDKEGNIIGSANSNVNYDTDMQVSVDITAERKSDTLYVEVNATKDATVLDTYSTLLSNPEKKQNSSHAYQIILIAIGIMIVMIGILVMCRKTFKKEVVLGAIIILSAGIFSGAWVYAAGSFNDSQRTAFLNGTDPTQNIGSGTLSYKGGGPAGAAGATLKINSPAPDSFMNPGQAFDLSGTMSWRTCLNSGGTGYIQVKVFDQNGIQVGTTQDKNISKGITGTEGQYGGINATGVVKNNLAPTTGTKFYAEVYGYISDPYGYYGGWQKKAIRFQLNALNPVCGSANGVTTSTPPSGSSLCSSGTPSAVTTNTNDYAWSCTSGANVNCSAPRTPGVCGSATSTASFNFPASNLCSSGTPANQTTSTTAAPHTWNCVGPNSGPSASCSVNRCASGQTFCSVTNSCLPSGQSCGTSTLSVQSSGATSVAISSSISAYAGTTNYSRNSSTTISTTLTAPIVSGKTFNSWSGCNSTNGANRTCTVSVAGGQSKTVIADYSSSATTTCTSPYLQCNSLICTRDPLCDSSTGVSSSGLIDIEARLVPGIQEKDKNCSITWSMTGATAGLVCDVYENGNLYPDNDSAASGYQVESGSEYQIMCKDSLDVAQAYSKTLKCVLNPGVNEI